MSPASKLKSKEKKVGKEPQKASSKLSGIANAGSGVPASAYNPLSGTFHTLEGAPAPSASLFQSNGRFRNIDETDDHSGSSLGAIEFDSISNNGSWSGESEDHKDKLSNPPIRHESIPGTDNDKREKIRQKNERKHQRQKERRAQELHERCTGYLMSRKLEALAQQLVAMGISSERATMAIMLNEGRLEASVAWLFEEEDNKHKDQNIDTGGNLKIDISEELARIADMEVRFKCSKQEVERAIVTCEGDLDKAAETLQTIKQEALSAPMKPEEISDPPIASNGKISSADGQNSLRAQPKPNSLNPIQQRMDEKEFYTKTAVSVGVSSESLGKNVQYLRRAQPKLEWAKPQVAMPAEKKWLNAGTNPSVSYSLASPLQVSPPPAKTESHYVVGGNEFKNLHPGSMREPVIMMQRPQSINTKQVPSTSTSSSHGTATSWYPSMEAMNNNGLSHIANARSFTPNNSSSNQLFQHYQHHQQFVSGGNPMDSQGPSRGNGYTRSRTGTSPTLAAASSLGLFSGLGTSGSSGPTSPVDWSTSGSMQQLDYTNIDWSLDRTMPSLRPGGLRMGVSSFMQNNTHTYDSNTNGVGANPGVRLVPSNRSSGISIPGSQDRVANTETSTTAAGPSSREWTSPFEGKDLFSLPRQFVSSPPL